VLVLLLWKGQNVSAQGKAIFQYPNETQTRALDQIQTQVFPPFGHDEVSPRHITFYFADGLQVRDTLNILFPSMVFALDSRTNSLNFLGSDEDEKRIRKVIRKLDKPLSQVKFEVEVMEINSHELAQFESVLAGLKNGVEVRFDTSSRRAKLASDIRGRLLGLVERGKAKVMAKPTLTVMEGETSEIGIGDRIPYVTTVFHQQSSREQVQFLNTGVQVQIKLLEVRGDEYIAEIDTSVSSIKLWKTFKDSQFPILSTRKAKTKARLINGETLILAGLLDEQETENESGIPIVSDIPVIGGLFKGTQRQKIRSDIVFLITPRKN